MKAKSRLNAAQELVMNIIAEANWQKGYKAPHANYPTPARPKRRRSMNLPLRPAYTGHRP